MPWAAALVCRDRNPCLRRGPLSMVARMLQIEIDTDAIAAPPEAFRSDRLHARSSRVPDPRAEGEARLGQRDEAVGAAAQEAVDEK